MMHHHTKFHEERLSGSEDVIRTNINCGLNPHLRHNDLEDSKPKNCHRALKLGDDGPLYQYFDVKG